MWKEQWAQKLPWWERRVKLSFMTSPPLDFAPTFPTLLLILFCYPFCLICIQLASVIFRNNKYEYAEPLMKSIVRLVNHSNIPQVA